MAVRDPLGPVAQRDQLTERLELAERMLGHGFSDRTLLAEALTHRSALQGQLRRGKKTRSNERLEFIGDRVVGLVIAEWLIERFPQEQEGALGRRHAQLVSRPTLAEIAECAGLGATLALGASEERAGVAQLANVLADALEAMIGATYLDGGIEPVRRFIRGAWARALDDMVEPPTDPKTALQEWLMARGLPLPAYRVVSRSGPSHAPEFAISVTGAGGEGVGKAGSKRLAERAAAADLLARLQA